MLEIPGARNRIGWLSKAATLKKLYRALVKSAQDRGVRLGNAIDASALLDTSSTENYICAV
jgi:hypothetical protein